MRKLYRREVTFSFLWSLFVRVLFRLRVHLLLFYFFCFSTLLTSLLNSSFKVNETEFLIVCWKYISLLSNLFLQAETNSEKGEIVFVPIILICFVFARRVFRIYGDSTAFLFFTLVDTENFGYNVGRNNICLPN